MPFTFSHPAIILPATYLNNRWYSLTGLVVGSMVPDFEYFLRMNVESKISHNLLGLFIFDLPLGLIVAFIFHNIVRNPLYINLPQALQSRLSAYTAFNWNAYFKQHWGLVSISVLIGALSHILWDNFTHAYGCFVPMISFLRNTVELSGTEIPYYKILQHSSTVIGALVIAAAIWKMPRNKNLLYTQNWRYWKCTVTIYCVFMIFRMLTGLNLKSLGEWICTSILAGMLALIFTPLLLKQIPIRNTDLQK